MGMTERDIMALVDGWTFEGPKQEVRKLMGMYGPPQEVTPMRAIWHNVGEWKRIAVIDEQVPHNFPMPHMDYLYQYIDYAVPPDKADDVLMFDGSVLIDVTKGEMGARCYQEKLNLLAVNLANDVIQGTRTWKEAQQFMREAAAEGKHPEYMERIQFAVVAPA